jgi:FkbM family methyltransferase
MNNQKKFIGKIPSLFISYLLRSNISRERKTAIINLVNCHPNWLYHVDKKISIDTNFGFKIWCDRWDVIGQTIIATGQWEGLLSRTITAALRPGDVAIDIGANIGYDTMLMSQAVGPTGSVHAFEPDLKNLTELIKNIANLDYNNVTIQSLALSDDIGMAKITVADQYNRGVSNLRPNEKGPSQPIFATRLDRLLDKPFHVLPLSKWTSKVSSIKRSSEWETFLTASITLRQR